MDISLDILKCNNCKRFINLSSCPYFSKCCNQLFCNQCQPFRCPCPQGEPIWQDQSKYQLLRQYKAKNRFLCQECKCSEIQYYCGKEQKFLCFKCLVKSCTGHTECWEEIQADTITKIAHIIDKWEDSLFIQGFKAIGREIMDQNVVIIDRDLGQIIQGLKTLNALEQQQKGDQEIAYQSPNPQDQAVGNVKLADLLKFKQIQQNRHAKQPERLIIDAKIENCIDNLWLVLPIDDLCKLGKEKARTLAGIVFEKIGESSSFTWEKFESSYKDFSSYHGLSKAELKVLIKKIAQI
ncbi:hypothetical protein FGO68_gene12780 [Halteria grandinella]|uniref:B box-type domain-containing protein n=1 Tax=Halteria grandinella TaxID=5974 RepID=A0A8J8P208_HALGN|nr:hypothetical protein FGO68_gene12780 [Halteria grandinella]